MLGFLLFPLVGGGPVDQVFGELFPVAATFDGDVADAIADDFIFADDLVAAVFEDEAVIDLDSGDGGVGFERERGYVSLLIAGLSKGWIGRNCNGRQR